MQCRLLASAGVFLLASAVGVADDHGVQRLWCPQGDVIDLAQCEESRPTGGGELVPVIRRGACSGEPGVTESDPQCTKFLLNDAKRGIPIHQECSVTINASPIGMRVAAFVDAGKLLVPTWSQDQVVSCLGFADVNLKPDDENRQVNMQPGRELIVSYSVDTSENSQDGDASTGRVSIRNQETSDEVTKEAESDPGTPLSVGSIPLGLYSVKIRKEGFAPSADIVQVTEGRGPLELAYALEADRCLTVHVACDGCDLTALRFISKRLSDSKAPITYADGSLALHREESLLAGEVCGLADGRYDLTLAGDAVMPVSRPVEVGANNSPITFTLHEGISSRVTLVDIDGLPFAGAEALITWRVNGRTQQQESTSDDSGEVRIPPLMPETRFRLRLRHEKCIPHMFEGLAGDDRVVQLMPPGSIAAQVVGEGCATDAVVTATVRRRAEDGHGYRGGTDPVSPVECHFEIPIAHPGTYDVTFGGPDFVSLHEVVEVDESERVDLGDIELERGERFRVRTLHSGFPVLNAAVRIGRDGEPLLTDDSGSAEFFCLSSDNSSGTDTEFFVDHPSFAPTRVVRLVKPDSVVDIHLSEGAEVYGVVLGKDGSRAVGETIHAALPNGNAFSATVSAGGEYSISRLEPGTWLVWRMRTFSAYGAVGSGFGTGESRTVELADGDRKEVSFQPDAPIRGRVTFNGQSADLAMTIGAVHSDGGNTAAIPISVDDSGLYSARLSQEGMWTFVSGESSFSYSVIGCPCVIDIDFLRP